MPSYYIEENLINEQYYSLLSSELNSKVNWVNYDSEKQVDFSNIKKNALKLTSQITNCTHIVNKFFSTALIPKSYLHIIPETYYLVNSNWMGKQPDKNLNDKWIMKDVWDYSEDNSQVYNSISECVSNNLSDKYYVIQKYIPDIYLIRCYIVLIHVENSIKFVLLKDGYLNKSEENNEREQSYQRLKSIDNYDSIFTKIQELLQIYTSLIYNNMSHNLESTINEYQVFECLIGSDLSDLFYILNWSIQLSICEKNDKIFNVLSNILVKDIVNNIIIPVTDNNEITLSLNKRWVLLDLNDEIKSEDNSIFMELVDNSKKKIYKLANTTANSYFFENSKSNNILISLIKVLEGLGDWKKGTKNVGLSDTSKSVVRWGINIDLSLNNISTYLNKSYLPQIYNSFNDISNNLTNNLWFVKNVTTKESFITTQLTDKYETENEIKDNFIMVEDDDKIIYQKEIDNLMLINNRKFIIRMYALVSSRIKLSDGNSPKQVNNVLLHKDGLIFCSPTNYDNTSENNLIHSFSTMAKEEGDISSFGIHFSDWTHYNKIYSVISKILTKLFKSILKTQELDDMSLELLTFDFAVDNNNKVYIVNIQNNDEILTDKRMWYSSVKIMMNNMLKDILDMAVLPYLNDNDIEQTMRWGKL